MAKTTIFYGYSHIVNHKKLAYYTASRHNISPQNGS